VVPKLTVTGCDVTEGSMKMFAGAGVNVSYLTSQRMWHVKDFVSAVTMPE